MDKTFLATIKKIDGKNKVVLKSPKYYQYQLDKIKEGTRITLAIKEKRAKRTEQQNRYYFGAYLALISEETGETDINALHELFKGKFLSEIKEVLGENVRVKKSTTELNVVEFSEYIRKIEDLTGIPAPPTENWID